MKRMFRKHFWVMNLLTLGACAIFAARALGAYLGSTLGPTPKPVTERHVVSAPAPSPRSDEAIRARNLFCSTCEATAEATPQAERGDGEPVLSTLPYRLVATLVSGDPSWSFAAVLDPETGRSRLVPIGGRLASAEVTEIGERRVLLRSAGRVEYLALDAQPSPEGKVPPKVSTPLGAAETGVRSLGAGRYEIRREALNRVLANTTVLAASARIMPAVRDGKPAGFMLQRIRPGSFYQLLGLRDGDIVQAVNGHPIRTPEDALQVYTGIKNASHVTLSVLRGGKSSTFDYTINSLGDAQAQL
jgi:general secretion pathway protein C